MHLFVINRKPFRDILVQFRSGFSQFSATDTGIGITTKTFCTFVLLVGKHMNANFTFHFHALCMMSLELSIFLHKNSLTIWSIADALGRVDCTEIKSIATYLYHAFKRRQELVPTEGFLLPMSLEIVRHERLEA